MDESQVENPVKLGENWRNADGTLKAGHAPLPGSGRPKGQTLKEYWKERFKLMSDEEKEAFSLKVGNEAIWKMAEGLPKTDIDLTAKLTIAEVIKDLENGNKPGNEIIGQAMEIAEPLQDTGQEEKSSDIPQEQSPEALPAEQVVEKYNPQE